MKKALSKYVCQSCGYESPRWTGKCPNCQGWNSFVEELASGSASSARKRSQASPMAGAVPITEITSIPQTRMSTGVPEFDRVLGGGIVPGAVVLVGGDPGIGKSTLMLQMASLVKGVVLYVTGEESAAQIKLRSERLGVTPGGSLLVLAETDIDMVDAVIDRVRPAVLIVDSIQTMFRAGLESAPGTVGQVREVAGLMMKRAKTLGTAVFLVGHVTKEGAIAGPKVVEHIVDTVLQFEGEKHYAFRVLRSNKNRFGSTNEIGIFEMGEAGLREVTNPSETFLAQRLPGASGSTVVASLEGTRPLLLEVQALVTPTSYGMPQRTATGFDAKRLQMLLAVLEKRVGLHLGQYDVFVNIAGGIRVEEPAVDLGVAVSIVSSMRDRSAEQDTVAVGEVGLGGEIRGTSQIERRIQEARKLGFRKVIVPSGNTKNLRRSDIEIIGVQTIEDAIGRMLNGS
ncbi:MAG: DNA repair protein RadA [Ignavibacteria bacterium]|nr:DNA repair protein RadA [Ignavibacteria bacterium]